MPPRSAAGGRRPLAIGLVVIAVAGIASFLAGRVADGPRSQTDRGPTPAAPSSPAIGADATALAGTIAVNGRLLFADAAFEADDPAAARQAIAQAATVSARGNLDGPAAALSEAFSHFVAAEDALAAGDLAAARVAYSTANARFEAALDGGALPGVVEPTHLFAEAGILYADGRSKLEAGDVSGALALLRAAESRRGKPYRPLMLTVEAMSVATATP